MTFFIEYFQLDCLMKTHLEHVSQVGSCRAENLDDIGYGFLLGGIGGFVVEGRGFDFQGQLTNEGEYGFL